MFTATALSTAGTSENIFAAFSVLDEYQSKILNVKFLIVISKIDNQEKWIELWCWKYLIDDSYYYLNFILHKFIRTDNNSNVYFFHNE